GVAGIETGAEEDSGRAQGGQLAQRYVHRQSSLSQLVAGAWVVVARFSGLKCLNYWNGRFRPDESGHYKPRPQAAVSPQLVQPARLSLVGDHWYCPLARGRVK